jgi:hypothetical protein
VDGRWVRFDLSPEIPDETGPGSVIVDTLYRIMIVAAESTDIEELP